MNDPDFRIHEPISRGGLQASVERLVALAKARGAAVVRTALVTDRIASQRHLVADGWSEHPSEGLGRRPTFEDIA